MNVIKMQVLLDRVQLNRWDKDSIRPGPVGSVGDVNLQVKLKKSAPYLPNRYQTAFSGKNEVWSGSNVSDGQWKGYTSGGRGAVTYQKAFGNRHGFKTAVGYVIEDIVAADRSKMAKMVPLGQYSWEEEKAKIYKSKHTGEQFLPLPNGYDKTELPRGSQYPSIVAESNGTGTALPAAEVNITDSQFGKQGSIGVDENACTLADIAKVWVPAMDDPRRNDPSANDKYFDGPYPYEMVKIVKGTPHRFIQYPALGDNVQAWDLKAKKVVTISTSVCGGKFRDPAVPFPTKKVNRAKEGDYRRDEQKKEEEKRKQKMK
jgi:hypothetical protein